MQRLQVSAPCLLPPIYRFNNIVDGSSNGRASVVTNSGFYILNICEPTPHYESMFKVPAPPSSVKFSSRSLDDILVATANDIYIVRIDSGEIIFSRNYDGRHGKIQCADRACGAQTQLIAFGTDTGKVGCTDLVNPKTVSVIDLKLLGSKKVVTCLQFYPLQDSLQLLAVGTFAGAIFVIDCRKAFIIRSFYEYSDQVLRVDWSARFTDTGSGEHDYALLASVSKDGMLKVWNYEEERSIVTRNLYSFSKEKSKVSSASASYSLCWNKQQKWEIFVSFPNGDICVLDLSEQLHNMKEKMRPVRKFVYTKPKCVRDMCICGSSNEYMLAFLRDRTIKVFNIESGKQTFNFYGSPNNIGLICPSSQESGTLAVVFDSSTNFSAVLYLWNLHSPHSYSINSYPIGKYKITAVSWHCTANKSVVALGDEHGTVSIFPGNPKDGDRPVPFADKSNCGVRYLQFAPIIDGSNFQHSVLYCLCNEILIYEPTDFNAKCSKLSSFIKEPLDKVCSFQWHSTLQPPTLALGSFDGCIDFYCPRPGEGLTLIQRLQCDLKENVKRLLWHPKKSLIAASFNSTKGRVEVFSDSANSESHGSWSRESMLNAQSGKVTCMCWIVLDDDPVDYLAVGSVDCTVQVYACTGQLISNFRGHSTPVKCLCVNPVDPNQLCSSGADDGLLRWQWKGLADKRPPVKKTANPTKKPTNVELQADEGYKVEVATGNITHSTVQNFTNHIDSTVPSADVTEPELVATKKLPLPVNDVPFVCESEQILAENKRRKGGKRSLFENLQLKSTADDPVRDFEILALQAAGSSGAVEFPNNLVGFADRNIVFNAIASEADSCRNKGELATSLALSVFCNQQAAVILEASESKTLNDFIVSMAASSGFDTWKFACNSYAQQLIAESQFQKAATYYLAVGRTRDAVQMLLEHSCFEDALMLAKCRLAPNDDLVKHVYISWAASLESNGAYEMAAKCWLAVGDFSVAVRLLRRRSTYSLLRASYRVAVLSGDAQLIQDVARDKLIGALRHGEFKDAYEVVKESGLTVWNYVVSTNEAMVYRCLTLLANGLMSSSPVRVSPEQFSMTIIRFKESDFFFHDLWHMWQDDLQISLPKDKDSAEALVRSLDGCVLEKCSVDFAECFTFRASPYIAASLASALIILPFSFNAFFERLNSILSLMNQYEVAQISEQIRSSFLDEALDVSPSCCSVIRSLVSIKKSKYALLTRNLLHARKVLCSYVNVATCSICDSDLLNSCHSLCNFEPLQKQDDFTNGDQSLSICSNTDSMSDVDASLNSTKNSDEESGAEQKSDVVVSEMVQKETNEELEENSVCTEQANRSVCCMEDEGTVNKSVTNELIKTLDECLRKPGVCIHCKLGIAFAIKKIELSFLPHNKSALK